MPQLKDPLIELGGIVKVAPVAVFVLGLTQIVVYTWFYGVPFPFSLGNLAVIGALSIVIGLGAVLWATLLYYSSFKEIFEWLRGRDVFTRRLIITVGGFLLLVAAVLPVTTSFVLRHIGIGGGLKVVYFLSKDAAVPEDILLAPNSRSTKPLFLVIDAGDIVYVRSDWKKREGCIGIQKSQINAVVQATPED